MRTGIHFLPPLVVVALVISTSVRGMVFGTQAELDQSRATAQLPWFDSLLQTTVTYSGGTSYGSGVLFQYNNWVALTGHQLTKDGITSVQFNVRGPDGTILESATADRWYIADWASSYAVGSGRDFALAHLSTPLSVTPAEPYYGSLDEGVSTSLGGCGLSGIAHASSLTRDFCKRAGNLPVTGDSAAWWAGPQYLLSSFMPGGCLSAPGDSGGGVYYNDAGTWKLGGIAVFGTSGNNYGYGNDSGAIRLEAVRDFVVATIPEPTSLAVLALGVVALFVTQRERVRLR